MHLLWLQTGLNRLSTARQSHSVILRCGRSAPHRAVGEELDRLIDAVGLALPEEESTDDTAIAPAEIDWEAAKSILGQLDEMQAKNDVSSFELFQSNTDLVKSTLSPGAKLLEDALLSWDFTTALDALRSAVSATESLLPPLEKGNLLFRPA